MAAAEVITTGVLQCRRSLLERDGGNATVQVPVRCILLQCRSGYWLFDAGQTPPEVPQPADAPFKIIVAENETAAAQLYRRRITLRGIVISHAHRDHTSGLRDFPGVRTLLQKREAESAAGAELMRQYPQQWEIIDGRYDFSGDGSALAVPTYGHTPGHQSLLLCDGETETLYAIDAAYTCQCIAGAAELAPFRRENTVIIPGHPVIKEVCHE